MSPDAPDPLDLTLSLGSVYAAAPTLPPSPPISPAPSPPQCSTRRRLDDNAVQPRRRRQRTKKPPPPPSEDNLDGSGGAPPPFPWATERPARHDTLQSLLSRGVTSVSGEARCRRCSATATVAYDLDAKFREVRDYVAANRHAFNDRAPEKWATPTLPDCEPCGQAGSMAPVIAADEREINWLFLLLGQTLGCCTLGQLKYFCKETGLNRTGAKNRLLYYAFVEICRQLEPQP